MSSDGMMLFIGLLLLLFITINDAFKSIHVYHHHVIQPTVKTHSTSGCLLAAQQQSYIPTEGLESLVYGLGNYRCLSVPEYIYAFQLFPDLKAGALQKQWPYYRKPSPFEQTMIEFAASIDNIENSHNNDLLIALPNKDLEEVCEKLVELTTFSSSMLKANRMFSQKLEINLASFWKGVYDHLLDVSPQSVSILTQNEDEELQKSLQIRGSLILALERVLRKQIAANDDTIVYLEYPSLQVERSFCQQGINFPAKLAVELLIRCFFTELRPVEKEGGLLQQANSLNEDEPTPFFLCSKKL